MAPRKPVKQPDRPSETLEQRLERVAIDTIAQAEAEQDVSRRVTAVRAAAMVLAERRKAEVAAAKRGDQLTSEQAVAWYRNLSPRERASFRTEIDHVDSRKSGLA